MNLFCHPGIFLERSEKKISGIQGQDGRYMEYPNKYTRLSYGILLLNKQYYSYRLLLDPG
jgi:hypothetical protein